jgi:uncharacterized protein HemX
MPTRSLTTSAESSRDKWMWALLALLALGQIVAFWMLCQNQVAQAQSRHAAVRAEHAAQAQHFVNASFAVDTWNGDRPTRYLAGR